MADERLLLFSAFANGTGAASILPLLCRRMAEQGLLLPAGIEMFRHSALLGFEKLREGRELSEDELKLLEQIREHADSLWHRAAQAAQQTRG